MTSESSRWSAPVLEGLEGRLFLDGTAPQFVTALSDSYVISPGNPLTIGVDATDAENNPVTITASTVGGLSADIRQNRPYAVLHFTKGDGTALGSITVQLFSDSNLAAVNQFINLATKYIAADGTMSDPNPAANQYEFYRNVKVHRIYPGFVLQTGDAKLGNGYGESDLPELPDAWDPNLSYANAGVLAYANKGPNTSDNQFFITADSTPGLNGGYIIFGHVISGWQTFLDLMATPIQPGTVDVPVSAPIMTRVDILRPGDFVEQDGTITFRAAAGTFGPQQINVTLTDSTGATTAKTVNVTTVDINTIADIQARPGQTVTFTPTFVGGTPTELTATADVNGVTCTVNPTTNQVTLTVPANYSGTMHVVLGADFNGQAMVTKTVNIVSSAFPDAFAAAYVMTNGGPKSVTVAGVTASGDPTTLTATTNNANLQASVSGNTVTFTALNGFTGSAQATLTLKDSHGLNQSKTVAVTVAGIVDPADIRILPGQDFSFTPTLVSDGAGGPTALTATTALAGAIITVNPATKLVSVDVPNGYTGTFTINLTASYAGLPDSTQSVSVTSSAFGADLLDNYTLSTHGPLTIPVDAQNAGNTAITVTAATNNPNVIARVWQNTSYAILHFKNAAGTAVGDILVQLFNDSPGSAAAVERFRTLATKYVAADGTISAASAQNPPFYTNIAVHRVVPNSLIQMGKKDDTGGSPLPNLVDSFDPTLSFAGPGMLAFANSGANTSDSQFFITDNPNPSLDGKYIVFGQLISGWGAFDAVAGTPLNSGTETPTNPPILSSVEILDPGQYVKQDATITLYAINGYAGPAQVTVTLTNADGTSQSKTVGVNVAGIAAIPDVHTGAGQAFEFTPTIVNAGTTAPAISVKTDLTGATATWNATTGKVNVTLPSGYTGSFLVTVTGDFNGLADSVRTVAVYAQTAYDPTVLAHVALTAGGAADGIFRVGNRLFVAAGATGLEIYDISTPASPRLLGSYDTAGYARDVVVVGNTAFVADTGGGLLSLNVSNPASITRNDIETPGTVVAIAVSGTTLLATAYDGGLLAYTFAADGQMTLRGQLKSDPWRTIQLAMDVVTMTYGAYTFAVVSDFDGGCWVVNATNPAALSFISGVGTGGTPWGMALKGSLLYVADQSSGLIVVSLGNLAAPAVIGQLALANKPWQVSISGDAALTTALVGGEDGLVFVDITDYRYLYVDYVYDTNGARAGNVLFDGKTVTAALGTYGVVTLNATNLLSRATVFGSRSFAVNGKVYAISVGGGAVARAYPSDANFTALQRLEIVANPVNYMEYYGFYWGTGSVAVGAYGGAWTIDNVIVNGMLASFYAPAVNVAGAFTSTGLINSVVLNNLNSGSNTVSINTAQIPFYQYLTMNLTVGKVADTTVNTNGVPIAVLYAAEWLDTGTANKITAPYITYLLTSSGAFQSDLAVAKITQGVIRGGVAGTWTLTDSIYAMVVTGNFAAKVTVPTITSLYVGGNMDSATLTLTAPVSPYYYGLISLHVVGWVKNTKIASSGNIYSVVAGGFDTSTLYVGVNGTALPSTWENFTATGTIYAVAVTGIWTGTTLQDSYLKSNIAAWTIGSLYINRPKVANDGTLFGACADTIGSLYVRTATTAKGGTYLRDWSQTVRMTDLIIRLV